MNWFKDKTLNLHLNLSRPFKYYPTPWIYLTKQVQDANTHPCPHYFSMDVTSNLLVWAIPPTSRPWYKRIYIE